MADPKPAPSADETFNKINALSNAIYGYENAHNKSDKKIDLVANSVAIGFKDAEIDKALDKFCDDAGIEDKEKRTAVIDSLHKALSEFNKTITMGYTNEKEAQSAFKAAQDNLAQELDGAKFCERFDIAKPINQNAKASEDEKKKENEAMEQYNTKVNKVKSAADNFKKSYLSGGLKKIESELAKQRNNSAYTFYAADAGMNTSEIALHYINEPPNQQTQAHGGISGIELHDGFLQLTPSDKSNLSRTERKNLEYQESLILKVENRTTWPVFPNVPSSKERDLAYALMFKTHVKANTQNLKIVWPQGVEVRVDDIRAMMLQGIAAKRAITWRKDPAVYKKITSDAKLLKEFTDLETLSQATLSDSEKRAQEAATKQEIKDAIKGLRPDTFSIPNLQTAAAAVEEELNQLQRHANENQTVTKKDVDSLNEHLKALENAHDNLKGRYEKELKEIEDKKAAEVKNAKAQEVKDEAAHAKEVKEQPAADPKVEQLAADPKVEQPAADPKVEQLAADPKVGQPVADAKAAQPIAEVKAAEPELSSAEKQLKTSLEKLKVLRNKIHEIKSQSEELNKKADLQHQQPAQRP